MTRQIGFAIAAACGSALMFVSVTSGAVVSLLLFYLAPLPLMIAALGFGSLSALIGSLLAGGAIGAMFTAAHALAFLVIVGAPAVILGYLAMLAQSDAGNDTGDADQLIWYPPGRILFWTAIVAAAIIAIALFSVSFDADAILASLRATLTRALGEKNANGEDLTGVIDLLARAAPAATGIVAMITLALNLWLAGRLALISRLLRRPWPDLRGIALPHMAVAIFGLALVLSFFTGLLALLAQIVTATLAIGFAFGGLSVLHALSLSWQGRAMWLGLAYAVVLMFGWPVLALCLIGLIDSLFDLRTRFAAQVARSPYS